LFGDPFFFGVFFGGGLSRVSMYIYTHISRV
jgi:hypothetical protein